MAVGMSYKSPFVLPPPSMRREAEEARKYLSQDSKSDHVTILKILEKLDTYRDQGTDDRIYDFCRDNYINVGTIQMISDLRQNIARELLSIGYKDPVDLSGWHNRNGSCSSLAFLQSAIVAGVFPNVAAREEQSRNFGTAVNKLCTIHRSSVNWTSKKSKFREVVAYGEMIKGVGAQYTINQNKS